MALQDAKKPYIISKHMIITCDIGNTSTKLGLYDGDKRVSFMIVDSKTSTPFKSSILQMIYKLSLREDQIEDAVVSSVVPDITPIVKKALLEILNKEAIIIDDTNYYGIQIDDEVKGEVGSDLLVICAYAYQKYNQELMVVSLGTASVFCHVTGDGKFKHCIIAPGYVGFGTSLYSSAAKLPSISAQMSATFLASNTYDAMSVGVTKGYVGMVKYLIAGLRQSIGNYVSVVSCGGAAKELIPYISELENYEPDLVSDGLAYIYERYLRHE